MCWASDPSCFKCNAWLPHNAVNVLKSRLCERCGMGNWRCYFCRRNDSEIPAWEGCSYRDFIDNPLFQGKVSFQECDCVYLSSQYVKGSVHTPPDKVPMCDMCVSLHNKVVCRSCFARDWQARCFRCRDAYAQRSQSHFCGTCYNKERKSVARNVFSSLPPSEWRMCWGPAWFDRRYVGSMLPLMPNMTDVGFKELEEGKYILLDEGLCLYLAEKAPAWRRHLERSRVRRPKSTRLQLAKFPRNHPTPNPTQPPDHA